jgi:hypothetical protein
MRERQAKDRPKAVSVSAIWIRSSCERSALPAAISDRADAGEAQELQLSNVILSTAQPL